MDHVEPILLSAYLDEELTTDERTLVEQHLSGCAACRTELEALRRTVTLFSQLPPVPLPRPFYLTEAMLEPAPVEKRSWWQRLVPLVAPLGAVAALLLVVVWGSSMMMGGTNSAALPASSEAGIAVAATQPAAADSARSTGDGSDASPEAAFVAPDEPATMMAPEAAPPPTGDVPSVAATVAPLESAPPVAASGSAPMAESTPVPAGDEPPLGDQPPVSAAATEAPVPGRVEQGGGAPQPAGSSRGAEPREAATRSPFFPLAVGFLVLAALLGALRLILYRRTP